MSIQALPWKILTFYEKFQLESEIMTNFDNVKPKFGRSELTKIQNIYQFGGKNLQKFNWSDFSVSQF